MEKLAMCRICLIDNVRMYHLVNTNLLIMYEKLTDMPFETKDRPLQVCYICCAKLRNCCQLQSICIKSEEMFSHALLDNIIKRTAFNNLNTFGTRNLDIYLNCEPEVQRNHIKDTNSCVQVKTEPTQLRNDMQVKEEELIAVETKLNQEISAQCTDLNNTRNKNERTEGDIFDCGIQHIKVENYSGSEFTDATVGEEIDPEYSIQATEVNDELYHKTVKETSRNNCLKSEQTSKSLNIREICPKIIKIVLHKLSLEVIHSGVSPVYKLLQLPQMKDKPQELSTMLETKIVRNENFNKVHDISQVTTDKEMIENSRDKKYKCDICNKYYGKRAVLLRHSRIHSGVKGYICDVCKKSFVDRGDLIKHFRKHTGSRPFKCDTCEKSFNDRYSLSDHKRTHTGERPYRCVTCDKCFTTKSLLSRHAIIHTDEKPFKCVRCNKGFSQKTDLFKHVRRNTGDKSYKCDICGKCFGCNTTLSDHVRSLHSGEKPFKCATCGKCWNKRSALSRHIRSHERVRNHEVSKIKKG